MFAPLVVFALAFASPYYSGRLSLVLHGRPFARVVPKEDLDVFHYVSTDSLACRAIVFSHGKAVGWICAATGSFAMFVPFSEHPSFDDVAGFEPWLNIPLLIAWALRWWFLPAQAVILLLWLRKRERKARCCGSDI